MNQTSQLGHTIVSGASAKPKYQFYLDSCEIMDTRSYHNDTIIAGLGVMVDGRVPQKSQIAQVGDHNNGKFTFWEKGLGSLDNIEIGPNDPFVFVFQLFNNGHNHRPNVAELDAFIDRDLINANADLGGLGSGTWMHGSDVTILMPGSNWSVPSNGLNNQTLVNEANYLSGGLFSAIKAAVGGCDGPLALGMVTGRGAALDSHIPAVGPLRLTAQYNAKHLRMGAPCNPAGSNYVVNVIVQRR